jgi:uncharacterized protein YcgL (UPF0745 family)
MNDSKTYIESNEDDINVLFNINNMTINEISDNMFKTKTGYISRLTNNVCQFYLGVDNKDKYSDVDSFIIAMFLRISKHLLKFKALYLKNKLIDNIVNIYFTEGMLNTFIYIAKTEEYSKYIVVTNKLLFDIIGIEKLYEIDSWLTKHSTYTRYMLDKVLMKMQSHSQSQLQPQIQPQIQLQTEALPGASTAPKERPEDCHCKVGHVKILPDYTYIKVVHICKKPDCKCSYEEIHSKDNHSAISKALCELCDV